MNFVKHLFFLFILIAQGANVVSAQGSAGEEPYQKGLKAYKKYKGEKAYQYFQEAAAAGNANAYYYLGKLRSEHWNPPSDDIPLSLQFFWKAASMHDTDAMNALGNYGLDQNFKYHLHNYVDTAIYYYGLSAGEGSTTGYNRTFDLLSGGDSILAIRFIMAKTSALAGNNIGMNNLAFCYMNGIGTAINKEAAKIWYQEAIANGNSSDNIPNQLRILDGLQPVYGKFDYRTLDQNEKVLKEHPERRLTKADLPGGYISESEIQSYNKWMSANYKSSAPAPAAKNPFYYTYPKESQQSRDQKSYDKMHQEANDRERHYNNKWGR